MTDINERLAADWSAPAISNTTQHLIDMLRARDAAGRAKYGTSLDRTDLSTDEWAQHMLEELLDAAGYLVRLREELQQVHKELDVLRREKVERSDSFQTRSPALGNQ